MAKKARPIFVLTDIHGCSLEMKLLLNQMPLTPDSLIIFLGDYVDRGPNAKDVIDSILDLKKNYEVICLKGNHEQMFMEFLADENSEGAGNFVMNGGSATLASYGGNFLEGGFVIPPEHREFLQTLDLIYETDEYIFVHAGLPDKSMSELRQDPKKFEGTFLWIRNPFFDSKFDWGKKIIHGHTPKKDVEVTEKRINLDTGCAFKGKLSALQLPEMKFYQVLKQDKERRVILRDQEYRRRAYRFEGMMPVYLFDGDDLMQFETINFSELDMEMRDVIHFSEQTLQVDQKIYGEIGNRQGEPERIVRFEGRVVRHKKREEGHFYGIEFTKTPYDFKVEEIK